MKWMVCSAAALMCVACSTVTPYTGAAAERSPQFGKLTKGDAVNVIRSQSRPASGMTDYGSFAVDEEGFGFKRTTHQTESQYRDGRMVTVTSTVWSVRNVPWTSVKRANAYLRDYDYIFTDEYIIELTYSYSDFDGSRRITSDEEFRFECRTEPDMLDTWAAIKALTGEAPAPPPSGVTPQKTN